MGRRSDVFICKILRNPNIPDIPRARVVDAKQTRPSPVLERVWLRHTFTGIPLGTKMWDMIASVASYICERSELYVRVGWRISLVYIYIYIYIYIYLYPWVDHLVPRGPRVTRNAQTSDRPV